jgi:DNA mismatch endonuclease, patch repair protein
MRANRPKSTGPELRLQRLLQIARIKGYRVNAQDLPGRPDLVFPTEKVAIFVNGCFWHRCPFHGRSLPRANRDYWRLKFQLNRERDRRKERALKEAHWRVVTIWECELSRNPNLSIKRVRAALSRGQAVHAR